MFRAPTNATLPSNENEGENLSALEMILRQPDVAQEQILQSQSEEDDDQEQIVPSQSLVDDEFSGSETDEEQEFSKSTPNDDPSDGGKYTFFLKKVSIF